MTEVRKRGPPDVRGLDGITIQFPGCKPRTCRTTEQIDAAMHRRSLFSLDPPKQECGFGLAG